MPTEQPDLAELGRYAYGRLRDRLAGLTDEELAWTPAPGVTGLAWRLEHIAALLTDERNACWLGVPAAREDAPPADALPADAPPDERRTAAGAVTMLDTAFRCWQAVLDAVPQESLEVTVGPAGGPYADCTRRAFVVHVLDELIHHGAEVALVRDFWTARENSLPSPV